MKIENKRSFLPVILIAVSVVVAIAISTILLLNRPTLRLSSKAPIGRYAKPTGPWTAYEKATREAFQMGDTESMLKNMDRAISLAEKENAPHTVTMFLLKQRGGIYIDNGNQEKFKMDCRRYVNLADKHNLVKASEDALIMLAQSEYDTGNYEQAEKDLDKLAKSLIKTRTEDFPGLVRVYELKGRVFYQQNRFDNAREKFLKSLSHTARIKTTEYTGSNGISAFYLSQTYKKNGKAEEALKYIRLAEKAEKDILYSKSRATFIDRQFMALPVPRELKEIEAMEQK